MNLMQNLYLPTRSQNLTSYWHRSSILKTRFCHLVAFYISHILNLLLWSCSYLSSGSSLTLQSALSLWPTFLFSIFR